MARKPKTRTVIEKLENALDAARRIDSLCDVFSKLTADHFADGLHASLVSGVTELRKKVREQLKKAGINESMLTTSAPKP